MRDSLTAAPWVDKIRSLIHGLALAGRFGGYDSPGRRSARLPGLFYFFGLRSRVPLFVSTLKGAPIMLRHATFLLAFLGALSAVGLWLSRSSSFADDKAKAEKSDKKETDKGAEKEKPQGKRVALQAFMRKKLEASQSVLEGLVVEDFDLISKGARQLKATSAAAEFMVTNDPLYAAEAADFGKVVDKLAKAAKEKRLDGSTLAYMDLTMSCAECHKYVRNVLVAK